MAQLLRIAPTRHNCGTDAGNNLGTNVSFCAARRKARGASAGRVRWLPNAGRDEEFTTTSDQAYVAAATASCQDCHSSIEVICVHCDSGTVDGEPLTRFTVLDLWAMDDALARQLEPWPTFRRVRDPEGGEGHFANHCPRCGSPQEDMYLHSEPDEPFFNIPRASPDSIELTPLKGTIKLSGDEHFEID